MNMALFKTFSLTALTLALSACNQTPNNFNNDASNSNNASTAVTNTEKHKIVIGTTVGDFADMVKDQIKPALEKQGYEVELKTFTDYVRPNIALSSGDLDMNVFQHKPYLDNFKAEKKLDIVEVFQVPTAPLGLYSGKLNKLTDAKEGSSVAAPNDPSNFARALVMMNDLGWIKLKNGINPLTASKQDIAENTKKINIIEMEAAQLPRSRKDVDFAIINGNYATDNGIKLTEALFQEKSFAYINWSAVRTADKNSKWVQDVDAAYNSDEFKQYAHTHFAGYKYPISWNEQSVIGAQAESASTASAASPAK